MKRWSWLLAALLSWASAQAGTLVQFRTAFGDIMVEMLDQDKPVTVQNFLQYVRAGHWTNMFSHRIVPGFIVQAGGYVVTNVGTTNVHFEAVPRLAPITNEFSVGSRQSNVFGTIAMAKIGGNPNSATSEWFFNLGDNSANLDNQNSGFTVFGHVVAGTNVLAVFNDFVLDGLDLQNTNLLVNLVGTPFPFDSRPNSAAFPILNRITAFRQVYTNLALFEISIPTVEVAPLNPGNRGLSWSSIVGLTNRVEYTTNLASGWQLLTNVVPTVARSSVVDPSNPAEDRFYRVRVLP